MAGGCLDIFHVPSLTAASCICLDVIGTIGVAHMHSNDHYCLFANEEHIGEDIKYHSLVICILQQSLI